MQKQNKKRQVIFLTKKLWQCTITLALFLACSTCQQMKKFNLFMQTIIFCFSYLNWRMIPLPFISPSFNPCLKFEDVIFAERIKSSAFCCKNMKLEIGSAVKIMVWIFDFLWFKLNAQAEFQVILMPTLGMAVCMMHMHCNKRIMFAHTMGWRWGRN